MGRRTAWQALMRAPWRFLIGGWPWRALGYLLISMLVALALTPLVVLTLVAVPLWALVIGAVERRRTTWLGFARQASGHVRLGWAQRHLWLGVRVTEAATWREVLALLVDLVGGLAMLAVLLAQAFCLVVIGTLGVYGAHGPRQVVLFADVRMIVSPASWVALVPLAVLILAVSAYLNVFLAAGQASVLRTLCAPRPRELERAVGRLLQSRAALVAAFETERRRIERDLHDGVQQELVTLAARLAMVSLELDDLTASGADAAAARAALDAAQRQAEHTAETLRDTVRGIHPAVLTDRGLSAALDELAERTPVPIRLDVADIGRLPRAVETAGYYLVTEAITNAAKHTASTRVLVRVRVTDGVLVVAVTDDGHGGADERGGTGLRGLRERAETLGGRLQVTSPVGGPTTLRLSVPVARERRPDAVAAG